MSASSTAIPVETHSPGDLIYERQKDVERGTLVVATIRYRFRTSTRTVVIGSYLHKLEFRIYSTVWLAKDQHKNRYVALKILAAGTSNMNIPYFSVCLT